MLDLLPDLCDKFPDDVKVLECQFNDYGQQLIFSGQIVTVKCFEDNSIVKQQVNTSGLGRVLVVDEQLKLTKFCKREILEGDISHPRIWDDLSKRIDLNHSEPIIILGTGSAEENLRASIWLKEKYPNALIISRSHQPSKFAQEVGQQHGIYNVSITQLVKENFPQEWLSL